MACLTRRDVRTAGISLLLVLAVAVAACASLGAWRARHTPLARAADSPDALARAVIGAIAARDADALGELALTQDEFRRYVWPELPVSRPEANFPFEFIWGRLHQQSAGYLRRMLAEFGGQEPELVRVEFAGATTDYGSVTVHRDTVLTIRTADGTERRVRLFGSTIEQAGHYKVFSYVPGD